MSSCLCKKAEGAVFPLLVEAMEDGVDDPLDAELVDEADHPGVRRRTTQVDGLRGVLHGGNRGGARVRGCRASCAPSNVDAARAGRPFRPRRPSPGSRRGRFTAISLRCSCPGSKRKIFAWRVSAVRCDPSSRESACSTDILDRSVRMNPPALLTSPIT
jgi:hypothetical protein